MPRYESVVFRYRTGSRREAARWNRKTNQSPLVSWKLDELPEGFTFPEPVAEVQVLVHRLERGGSEVRLRWPDGAWPGQPDALSNQAEFIVLVVEEVRQAAELLGGDDDELGTLD